MPIVSGALDSRKPSLRVYREEIGFLNPGGQFFIIMDRGELSRAQPVKCEASWIV